MDCFHKVFLWLPLASKRPGASVHNTRAASGPAKWYNYGNSKSTPANGAAVAPEGALAGQLPAAPAQAKA